MGVLTLYTLSIISAQCVKHLKSHRAFPGRADQEKYLPHRKTGFLLPQSEELRLLPSLLPLGCSPGLTGCLHHAGPELGLLVERVIIRAAEFVDVHTGRSAHAAVVADEHVKVLPGNTAELGNEVLHSPQLQQSLSFPTRSPGSQEMGTQGTTNLAHGAAVGEAWSGEAHDLPRRFIADHVEVVLQRGVLGALEVHQLGGLIDPDLCQERGLRDRQGQALLLCQPRAHRAWQRG